MVAVTGEVLVLRLLQPRRYEPAAWERLAPDVAGLHATTSPRFGWHRHGWLGARRQHNAWKDDGHVFFARHGLLRWLPEPRVRAKLDGADRRALERLCERLPELLPSRPACLMPGVLWSQNVMATSDGSPALIDPAVSLTWAEVTGLDAGWRDRMPLLHLHLRQLLALVAMFDDDWGSTQAVKSLVAPFRTT